MSKVPKEVWIRSAIEEHQGVLLLVAAAIAGREHAPDIVQEGFLRLCQQEPGIVADVRAWLLAVCRNLAIDRLREGRRVHVTDGALDEPVPDSGPLGRLLRTEKRNQVLEAIGALPERQQELVRLRFAAELSYKEIADATGLSVSNVGLLLHKAVCALRARLLAKNPSEHSALTTERWQ